jgi:hypothetical protein
MAACVAAVLVCSARAQNVDPSGEQQLVQLVNAERAKQGLGALEVDQRLTEIARKHSELMSERGMLSHQFPNEPDMRARVATTGMRFNFSGENVAYDSDIESAHVGLMHSPKHKENILRPQFNAIGIGVVRKGTVLYVTEDFAERLPEMSLSQAEQTIANSFSALRRQAGAQPLQRVELPALRNEACEMAKADKLSPAAARTINNVRNVVVWTATDLADLPPTLQKLRNAPASGYSLGACFASSKSYPNAVYWVVLVTYF